MNIAEYAQYHRGHGPFPDVLFDADFTTQAVGAGSVAGYGLSFARASFGYSVQTAEATALVGGAIDANDVPRYGRNRAADAIGLVIEATRTNLIKHSRDPTQVTAGSTWFAGSGATVTTRPYGVGPDGDATTPTRSIVLNNQFSRHFRDFASVGTVVNVSWWTRPENAAVTARPRFYTPGVLVAPAAITGTAAWQRVDVTGTTTSGNPDYYLGDNSGAAGASDQVNDLCQAEAGRFPTEAIVTAAATVVRAGERLFLANGIRFVDQARISMEVKMRPKGTSAEYQINGRLCTADANNYLEFDFATARLRIVCNGNTYLAPTAMAFARYDVVEIWVEAGGGALPTVAKYRVNAGATTTLSTGAPVTQPGFMVPSAGALDIFCNGTSNQFTGWFERFMFYRNGRKPAWV